MYEDKIQKMFDSTDVVVLTNQTIKESIHIPDNHSKILNTELKRMCDKKHIARIGKGIYANVINSRWGVITPTVSQLAYTFYIANDVGYVTGAEYLNRIGISTLIPIEKEIVTNKYRYVLYTNDKIKLIRPVTTITKENEAYLQLLDGVRCLKDYHADTENIKQIFFNEANRLRLDHTKLILLARKYYTKQVLEFLLNMEEQFYEPT
jgi:hypothetical protein